MKKYFLVLIFVVSTVCFASSFDHDNCPFKDNSDQADSDGDGIGDACDACPNIKDTATPPKLTETAARVDERVAQIWQGVVWGCPAGVEPTLSSSVSSDESGTQGGGSCSLALGTAFPKWEWSLFLGLMAAFWVCRKRDEI